MLCENCNQNEATIHYTEVINGVKTERHLCGKCMQELDYSMEGEFPFSKLIRGILSSHLVQDNKETNPLLHLRCDKCGMTYQDFTKIGKFGCAECYNVFGPLILDNIKKIQGSSTHIGKKYKSVRGSDLTMHEFDSVVTDDETKLKKLSEELQSALAIEDYEQAAKLRDEMKLIRGGTGKNA